MDGDVDQTRAPAQFRIAEGAGQRGDQEPGQDHDGHEIASTIKGAAPPYEDCDRAEKQKGDDGQGGAMDDEDEAGEQPEQEMRAPDVLPRKKAEEGSHGA